MTLIWYRLNRLLAKSTKLYDSDTRILNNLSALFVTGGSQKLTRNDHKSCAPNEEIEFLQPLPTTRQEAFHVHRKYRDKHWCYVLWTGIHRNHALRGCIHSWGCVRASIAPSPTCQQRHWQHYSTPMSTTVETQPKTKQLDSWLWIVTVNLRLPFPDKLAEDFVETRY